MKACDICSKSEGRIRYSKELEKFLCNKHYSQFRKHGKIFERTRYDKNEVILYEDYAELVLYDKDQNETARALIDIDDIEKVTLFKWCLESDGYVCSTPKKNGPKLKLHRFVMDAGPEEDVDHIFHNKLDCRKSKLRKCTNQQNGFNRRVGANNSTGVKGVVKITWGNYKNKKWKAQIWVNGKSVWLGNFDMFDEAVEARQKAEEQYFGEFRCLDKPEEEVI